MMLVTSDERSDSSMPRVSFLAGPSRESDANASLEEMISQGSFPGEKFHQESGYTFWRFSIKLSMQPYEQKIAYSINSHTKPEFRFLVPGTHQSMNTMSFSCNGFTMPVDTSKFQGSMWLDVVRKHSTTNGYHVMLGGGDQLYADSVTQACGAFKEWLEHKSPVSNDPLTPEIVKSYNEFYLHLYLQWYGQGWWKGNNGTNLEFMFPVALCTIPSINIWDDHDILDGFGSYKEKTMQQPRFAGIGDSAYKYYMLFQHQMSAAEETHLKDPSWILGNTNGPSIKQRSHSVYTRLGREIAFVGLDCRTERSLSRIVYQSTYDAMFQRLAKEVDQSNGDIKHVYLLLGVPIAYPRLVWLEYLLTSRLLAPLRYLGRKRIMAKGLVNDFDGSAELLDDLDDHWCSRHHKHERNDFISSLTKFAAQKNVRITILSGDVHQCCIGRFRSRIHQHGSGIFHKRKVERSEILAHPTHDPRLIFNLISSAIVNAPPPDAAAAMLNRRALKIHRFNPETDEDMVPIFPQDVDGSRRNNVHFLNKRNWSDLIPIQNCERFQSKIASGDCEFGKFAFPGPLKSDQDIGEISDDPRVRGDSRGEFVGYTVGESCVISSLYVEKKSEDAKSSTTQYQLVIPALTGDHRKMTHFKAEK